MELTYFIASVVLALFFLGGLRRYDGPTPNSRSLDRFYLSPHVHWTDKLDAAHHFSIRRSLSGSWVRASWLVALWLGVPLLFFSSDAVPEIAALILALPGGWALAVAIYNIRKRIHGQ
jgi:hypothetical protein